MLIDYKQAAEFIKSSDNIHILTHQSPDGDTLGSGFALWHALRLMNKKAAVICPDGITARYAFLGEGYEEPEEFEPDTVIAVDIADPKLLGDLKDVYDQRINLCIDHHISNIMYAERTLLNGLASAACEVLYMLFTELDIKINENIAKCIYTGLATDTGCFKFSNTSTAAHCIAGELIKYNINFAHINREMFDIKSKSRIALEQYILNNMEEYFDDRCAIICLSEELRQNLGVPSEEFDGVAGLPLQIEGKIVALTFKEVTPAEYKISMRSVDNFNVSRICQQFGGGGHVNAAGCKISGTVEEVKRAVLEAVGKAFGELD